MSGGRRYVLDANVFIEAHRTYYGFDLCPGFWNALRLHHAAKRVFSIDRVRMELAQGKDALSDWARDKAAETFFKRTASQHVAGAFGTLMNWVQNEPRFTVEAKAEFAAAADGWVIAYAIANGLFVVTHEEYAPEVKRRVPIPNVCLEFGVHYCNTFEMLRELKVQFVLRTKRRHKA